MKIKKIFWIFIFLFLLQILFLSFYYFYRPVFKQDRVLINQIEQDVILNWESLNNLPVNPDAKYAVIDLDDQILYQSHRNISVSVDEAIAHWDLLLDIEIENILVGKIIIYNESIQLYQSQKNQFIILFALFLFIQFIAFGLYFYFFYLRAIHPFIKLKTFATKISEGDFNTPLLMSRGNLFGAFTESFDIMRSELLKAKENERIAKESEKQLIANLSHDIKTPIASIKALAEVGKVKAENRHSQEKSVQIENRADHINVLITNLFSAAIEELNQLTVQVRDYSSDSIEEMIQQSDYLNKCTIMPIPPCLLSYDSVRLQQVIDNIIINSYKYANTKIQISFDFEPLYLVIRVQDYGNTLEVSELNQILQKFKRGNNIAGKEGAGLGLYISHYLMNKMESDLSVNLNEQGFLVEIKIALSR